jgi:hypothetical protein
MNTESGQSETPKRANSMLAAFEIDDRIALQIEFELARHLGMLILDSDTANTALLALGHQLRNLTDGR